MPLIDRATVAMMLVAVGIPATPARADGPAEPGQATTTLEESFDGPDAIVAWKVLDPTSWRVEQQAGNHVLRLFQKVSDYKPPHRSPTHVAVWDQPAWQDFELSVRVRSTHPDYGHRDVCLFFGWQDAAHFYYVHLGREPDPHCHQIFVVDGADRIAITTGGSEGGAPWDDAWHTLRIERETASGRIAIYWDDRAEPMLTANDKRFASGKVGLGSFDDTADFDDLQVVGTAADPGADQAE